MAEDVVVGCQLRFDPGHGNKAAHAQIHAVRDLRNVNIYVFERGIKTILVMIVQQLAAQVTLPDGEAVVRAVKGGEVIAPVDVVALYGIWKSLGVKHNLVQLETIRVEIIRLGRITACGRAEVQSWSDPAIYFNAAP